MAQVEIIGKVEDAIASEMAQANRKAQKILEAQRFLRDVAPDLPEGLTIRTWASDLAYPLTVTFPREMLPRMRQALGKLSVSGKDLSSGERRTIWVNLSCEAHPNVNFRYERELVAGGKCDIVERTYTPESEHRLVCNI